MRVLIFGGTGAMGAYLVEILSRRTGLKVWVTSRSKRDGKENVSYIRGDASDFEFARSVLELKWDVIVDFMVYSTEEFLKRRDLLLRSTGQYFFVSSGRAYSGLDHPLKECDTRLLDTSHDQEFVSSNDYAIEKAHQEDLLASGQAKNWTIICPYITYSESRFQLGVFEKEEWLYRALKGRTIVFSSDIAIRLTTMTHGRDVATGIAELIGREDAYGEKFNIASSQSYSWIAVLSIYLKTIQEITGRAPRVLLLGEHEFLLAKPSTYQLRYDRLFNRSFDNSKIQKLTGFSEYADLQVGLSECVKFFCSDPKFGFINWKSEAIKDCYTNEHTPLREIPGFRAKLRYIHHRYFTRSLRRA